LKKIARKLYSFTVQADISGRVFEQFPPKSLREPMTIIDLNRFSRILDVGSGSGLFLYSLRENGMKNLLGIDKYIAGDINYEKGLTVKKLPLGQVDGPWDLIMFHHSFEHDFQPEQTLVDVAALLADGGLCWIRMPMVPSYAWLHYRTDWINLDAPRHLFIHSIESMRVLSEKAGLELCHVVYDSTEGQFLGSEQAARGIPLRSKESYAENPAASIFTQDDINRYRRQAEELNLKGEGDSAAIFLRKKGTENS
jgi:SAM-dependent methyltransferase